MSSWVAFHGFTGGPESFDALDLACDFRPYSAGHGPLPFAQSASFDDEVARLVALLRTHLAQPARLLGYSMGARLGLAVALAAPDLVQELILLGVNPGLQSESERAERRKWEQSWIDMLHGEGLTSFEAKWSAMPLFASQRRLGRDQQAAQKATRLSHSAEGLAHSLSVVGLGAMPNLWPQLTELRVPTRCIVGADDEKFRAIAKRMVQRNASIQCCTLANTGHNPLLEAPGELKSLLEQGGATS